MGRKRSRAEFEEDDEYLELLRPSKRLSEQRPRLRRSNSIDSSGRPLHITHRYTANTSLKRESMKDFSIIACFSREAFKHFGKKWEEKMNANTLDYVTKSSLSKVNSSETTKLLSLQSRSVVGTDFEKQVQKLLENKTIPHVIAVIEGKEEKASLSLSTKVDDKSIDVPYTRVKYVQGVTSNGTSDNKQSMNIYVRDDMKGVYTISEESVKHVSTNKMISSVAVNYATEDGINFRTLVVHIPNEFIGSSSKESSTHLSFQRYATEQGKASSPVVVTSYFGDTNYSKPMSLFSAPSMGGHSSTGDTLNPQSSGAIKETHFMQSVALSEGHSKHSVLQPSTLNYVFINGDSVNREATDHPSFIHYVAHDSRLSGKNFSPLGTSNNPDFL